MAIDPSTFDFKTVFGAISAESYAALCKGSNGPETKFAGDILCDQGHPIDQVILIVDEGRVSIDLKGRDRALHYGLLRKNDLLGEFELIRHLMVERAGRRNASLTATVIEPTRVIFIDPTVFRACLRKDHQFSLWMLNYIGLKLEETLQRNYTNMFLTGRELVSRVILRLAKDSGMAAEGEDIAKKRIVLFSIRTIKKLVPGNPRTIERAIETLVQDKALVAKGFDAYLADMDILRRHAGYPE